jgi:hypothetical protein
MGWKNGLEIGGAFVSREQWYEFLLWSQQRHHVGSGGLQGMGFTRITIGFSANIHIWENEKKTILAAWILDLLNWLHRFL